MIQAEKVGNSAGADLWGFVAGPLSQLWIDEPASLLTLILTLGIAVAAWATIAQTRRVYRLSHSPAVKIFLTDEGPGKVSSVVIRNRGLGPAFIQKIEIYIGDKKLDGSLAEAVDEALIVLGTHCGTQLIPVRRAFYQEGYPIRADDEIALIEFSQQGPMTPPTMQFSQPGKIACPGIIESFMQLNGRIDVTYTDMFGKIRTESGPHRDKML